MTAIDQQQSAELEKLSGIVKRITFHSVETGYTVLKVNSFQRPQEELTKLEELRQLIDRYGIRQSMNRADNLYDNAFAESFWNRFKAEVVEDGAFLNVEDARTEIFDYYEI